MTDATQTVLINDKPYVMDELSEKAKYLLSQVADLDQKLKGALFNVDQLQISKNAFIALLEKELPEEAPNG